MSPPNALHKRFYRTFSSLFADPILMIRKVASIPRFFINLFKYYLKEAPSDAFKINFTEIELHTYDRWSQGGSASGHYFWQDLWAAKEIYKRKLTHHYDVGSRIDGFIAHILPFCKVSYVDLRPIKSTIPNLEFIQGSITKLPFESNSLPSLSCLHVIEHIGLGRYGDPIDPYGHIISAKELSRVIAPGGFLLLGTPVGSERVVFDGHRTFNPRTIVSIFSDLKLASYKIISDEGDAPVEDTDFSISDKQYFGCGLFLFEKIEGN